MKRPEVTIVLPVYNVEKYLDRCIESLVNQTYKNLEIILVNDCSSDGSGRICDEWAKRDARIRVIHKEVNEGQDIARNNALEIATVNISAFLILMTILEVIWLLAHWWRLQSRSRRMSSCSVCDVLRQTAL